MEKVLTVEEAKRKLAHPVTMTITEHGPAPVSPNVPRVGGVTVTLPNADAMAKTVYR